MSDNGPWRKIIDNVPTDGTKICAGKLAKDGRVLDAAPAYWFEGDTSAGWANVNDRPLRFEPTHWRPET